MNKTKDSIMGWLSVNGTYLYILIMLIAFPLFNTQKMFDLDADKTNFFLNITILYACIILLAAFKAVWDLRKEKPSLKAVFEKPDIIFATILLTAVILSTIFALDIRKSFFGLVSRDVSSLCFLLCIMVYFAVRQYGTFDGIVLWGWLIGSTIIYLIGICNACGINFMHIQDGLIPSERGVFLTPLSNIDCNTCYVCLALPPIIIMYMTCKEHFSQILHGINVYMGFLFIYFIKTDSAILVFIAGILILGYFALEKQIWSERYMQITGLYLGAKATIRILLYFFEDKLLPFYGTHLWLLSNKVLISEFVCYLLFFVVWKWKKELLREKLAFVRKYIVSAAAIAAILFIICIVYANVKAPDIAETSPLNRLVITDYTFSTRGYMWKKTSRALLDAPLKHKLIGNGLNCFSNFMGADSYYPNGNIYTDPHNEFMQIAANMGLIGLIGYFGLIISTLVRALRNWRNNELQIAVALTFSMFLIQGLVNACAIYHLPILFIFLGLANGSMQKKE